MCHEDGRHVMTVNAEQIGSVGKEERPGGRWRRRRRQMAELARCQPYRDMTTQGKPPSPPLPSPSHLLLCVFTCWRETRDCERGGSPPNADSLGFFWVVFCICNQLTCDARRPQCHPKAFQGGESFTLETRGGPERNPG